MTEDINDTIIDESTDSLILNEDVLINFSPVWCKIESNNSEELDALLYNNLCYHPEGYFYAPTYQSGVWDGWNRLYKPGTRRFRSGMLSQVKVLLEKAQCRVQIENFPETPSIEITKTVYKNADSVDIELRPYQINAVKEALSKRFGIIQIPPRGGKTIISAAIIERSKEFPVNFFTRSKDLAYQTKKVFDNNFSNVGFICDGICEIGDINIITIQSAYSAYGKKLEDKKIVVEKEVERKDEVKQLIKNTKNIFYDEVHHSKGNVSKFLLEKCINATMKIGLSATPFSDKADAIVVEETIGLVIFQISYSELIKEGFLMKPYIYMYKLPKMDLEGVYKSIYKQAVVENEFINKLLEGVVKKLNSLGKSVVIQTEYVQHSKDLAERLNCEYLTGKDSTEKRQNIKDKLTNKEILCLVSTLFEEGLDLVSLDYTINLVGGLDNIGVFQKMRSITAHKDKTKVGIIDFIHQCKYLKRHSKRRLDLYKSEPEFSVEIRDVSKKSIDEIFV